MAGKKFKVDWAEVAYQDLESIIEYITNEDVINAVKVLDRIEEKADTLNTLPNRGRIVPELKWHGVTRYRELVIKPWRLIYRVEGKQVWVVAVLDSRRNLHDLLLERFLHGP